MYDNRVHSVEHRIVSISQPWIRPIIRGKVKAPVEFGAKFDLSLDSEGYGRIEKISFEAYNESTCLIEAIERFKARTGYYPERVFGLGKRCYGMSCITTKLQETQMTSIALSVFVTNLFRILRRILCTFLYQLRFLHDWNRYKSLKLQVVA